MAQNDRTVLSDDTEFHKSCDPILSACVYMILSCTMVSIILYNVISRSPQTKWFKYQQEVNLVPLISHYNQTRGLSHTYINTNQAIMYKGYTLHASVFNLTVITPFSGAKSGTENKTKIEDVPVTCNNPLAHMRSHTTYAILQYVELYSLLVIPAIEHGVQWFAPTREITR